MIFAFPFLKKCYLSSFPLSLRELWLLQCKESDRIFATLIPRLGHMKGTISPWLTLFLLEHMLWSLHFPVTYPTTLKLPCWKNRIEIKTDAPGILAASVFSQSFETQVQESEWMRFWMIVDHRLQAAIADRVEQKLVGHAEVTVQIQEQNKCLTPWGVRVVMHHEIYRSFA